MPHPHPHTFKRMVEFADDMGLAETMLPEYGDYLLAGYFSAGSVRDKVNAVAFQDRINDIRPLSTVNVFPVGDTGHRPLGVFIFTHPEVGTEDISELLLEMERDGNLDEDAYWRVMDPIIQDKWKRADATERLEYVSAGDDPMDAILSVEVPSGAAAEIWRQIDD